MKHISEAQNPETPAKLLGLLHEFGGIQIGDAFTPRKSSVHSATAHAILLDLTHDNDSAVKKKFVTRSIVWVIC